MNTDNQNNTLSPTQSPADFIPMIKKNQEYKQLQQYRDRMQKILSALYMVTSLFDSQDPLGQTIRSSGTSALVMINHILKQENKKTSLLNDFYHQLDEIHSYMNVAHINKFFSDMNHRVITTEIIDLKSQIIQTQKLLSNNSGPENLNKVNNLFAGFPQKGSQGDFSQPFDITKDAQQVTDIQPEAAISLVAETETQKQNKKQTQQQKDSPIFVEKNTLTKPSVNSLTKKTKEPVLKKTGRKSKPKSSEIKTQRKDNILKILKQKKDATINDIYALFKDCSSKTIQRDLIELIEENKVVKQGSRRWSTYNLA